MGVTTLLTEWLGITSAQQLIRPLVQLLLAMFAGAVIGTQRQHSGKTAGLRTHMLVALGTTMFVVAAKESGMNSEALSRVMQGIAAGIGFLGAGTILKHPTQPEISGLTTAAGIWMTAGIAIAIGLGEFALGLLGTALTWITLAVFLRLEARIDAEKSTEREQQ